ncbi:disulfide bond formation protein DsbA [Rhodoblastus sphagnicola]|uniref:Disulfide bond formation protein DsbA n=1 Tax=Rhodoblastus sphagnicola TaxID=333368 RepID=A0A2S6ND96_9HYPH|nr:DsbA family protein [Rhodoblastus sphagnicola]MBB4197972.1 protein-disulfide isomerase [Rhodoblastus sphagnicola]PPQ32588.1 disulfide bond formation protein DsbA [Rhodoblastus sphagnicola]
MSHPRKITLAAVAGLLLALPVRAAEFSAPQKSEIETIVKNYLVSHPEILRDMAAELESRQKTEESDARRAVIAHASKDIFNSDFQAVLGNPTGKVSLVEFFDYNCGYCKRALGDLANLIKSNPDLRVVLKDFPVLGADSVEAAQIASAARNQLSGAKFWDFHQKLLMTKGHVGREQALAVAKEMGLDMAKLQKDAADPEVKDKLASVLKLGDSLSINGTPSYVLGDEVVVGAVGYDELKAKLDAVAKCGKTAC